MVRSFLVGAALVLAGCSSGELSLGVQITPQVSTAASALKTEPNASPFTTLTADVTQQNVDATLVMTRVRLLLSDAKLTEQSSATSSDRCPNMGSGGTDLDPSVVDLSADDLKNGTTKQISLGKVASGSYTGAHLEIEPLDGREASSTLPDLADFKAQGASVIIDGTYNDKPFQFVGHFEAAQTSTTPIEVGGSASAAVMMTVDTTRWFQDASGASLDPTDAANHDAIAASICTTLDTAPVSAEPMRGFEHHGKGGHEAAPARARCSER